MKVRYIRLLAPVLILLAAAPCAQAALMPPDFAYSQDGVHFQIDPALSEHETVHRYYRLRHDGQPRFGTPAETDTIAMYWDRKDETLDLLLVSGVHGHHTGRTQVEIAGLPDSVIVALAAHDKHLDVDAGAGTVSLTLKPNRGVSAIALGGLEDQSFILDLDIQSSNPDLDWRLATGSGRRDQRATFENLNPADGLIIETDPPGPERHHPVDLDPGGPGSGTGPGTSIPEPGTLGLIGFAALGLLGRPRRQKLPNE